MYVTVKATSTRAVKPTVLFLWLLAMESHVKQTDGESVCNKLSQFCISQLRSAFKFGTKG